MARYVGVDKTRIIWVSDIKPSEDAILVPNVLDSVDDATLMSQYIYDDRGFVHRNPKKEIKDLKIAFVGVWKIQCGISTYLEFLLPEMVKHISDYRIFCEIGDSVEQTDKVIPCWKRGESLNNLKSQVLAFQPDVILVQHEYGIFPDARRWLSFISSIQNTKTFVMFHSIYHHQDKTICEAVVPNIMVHTELAKKVLVETKGIAKPIHVIPHGCHVNPNKPRLWNLYKSDHTFMQFGFGFEYKGWENSLEACAILKQKYPDVFFTGLFSESKFSMNIHDRYYDKLSHLIQDMDLGDNCSIIRGYQSDEVLDSFFRINKCAIFPYRDNGDHTVYGVTGAARIAMKSGIPVVTSSVPFFYDLTGTCPQANNPKDLAAEIEKMWAAPQVQVEKQNAFLVQNSWANVAQKYLEVLSGKDSKGD